MLHLTLLETRHYRPISFAALTDVFTSVNRSARSTGMESPFFLEQVTLDEDHQLIRTPLDPPDIKYPVSNREPDIILVPAFNYEDIKTSLEQNTPWVPVLRSWAQSGCEIAGFCTGAFLLAAAGLLDQKKATTHLMYMDAFQQLFPQVQTRPDAVVIEDSGIYTSGGATSSFHLMLHLIKKYCGTEASLQAARMFAIDPDRNTQSYFGDFNNGHRHSDTLVKSLQDLIDQHFADCDSVTELMKQLPASRRSVYRRFKNATSMNPHEYLQKVRIDNARKLLEQSDKTVSEIMYECGYSDAKTFRQLFRKTVGITPKSYRGKFNLIQT